jgi:mono/diheme cytochrome c family protein
MGYLRGELAACARRFAGALACTAVGAIACSQGNQPTPPGIGILPPSVGPTGELSSATNPHPDFGKTVTLAHAPPAITGGTLLVTRSGTTAVAADPDRDQIYVIDLQGTSPTLTKTISLQADDEPGRLVEDGAGRIHVALRRGGAIVTVDLTKNAIVDRTSVCAAPRGIAYASTTDDLFVACNGGELVTLPAGGGAVTRTLRLVTDLRDVLIEPGSGTLYVSRFRQAELLRIASDGTVMSTVRPSVSPSGMEPDMAWRTIAAPPQNDGDDWMAMVHQRAQPTPVAISQGGYGHSSSGCPQTSIIETTVTTFDVQGNGGAAPSVPAAVLPVDIAASPNGSTFAIVAAGNAKTPSLPSVFFVPRTSNGNIQGGTCAAAVVQTAVPGQATAIAFADDKTVWVQTREPAALMKVVQTNAGNLEMTESLTLSTESREDTGHSIVHSNSGAFIACASCHGEGGEDGRVWEFQEGGTITPFRRTQSMRGTLEDTAPYHWEGDLTNISSLAHEVFVTRMDGQSLTTDQAAALQAWLFAVPRPSSSPPADAASAARGSTLFHSTTVGCSGCHSGPHFTNNKTLDVGTGGLFQVPSLIGVGWRSPYFHDGRAPQLVDRFNPALSGSTSYPHGNTSGLTTSEVDDLLAYLQTL